MMPTPLTWDATVVAANEIPVNWKDLFLGTECRPTGLQTLLGRLSTLGFCRIQEVPALQDSVLLLANAIGYVRRTVFGDVWTFSEDGAMADSAYSAGDLRPHTDGTYSEDAPGLQLLLCLEYAAKGGLSVLVDGFRIVQALAPEHRRMLEKVGVTGRYRGDGVDLQATRPIVRRDSAGNLLQISFNNYDRAPLWLPEPEMTAFYDALRAFDLLANDPTMQWQTQLAVGELIVFDNWRLLHGRTSYQGHRTMTGCYVNREDFLSCLRTQPDTLPG